MERLRSPLWLWLPVFLLVAVIYACSSLTAADIHRFNVFRLSSETIHRIGHLVEYLALGVVFLRALLYTHTGVTVRRVYIVAAVALILFAGTDEWHQTFVAGRHGRASDVLYDILCFTIGIGLYSWYRLRREKDCES